MAGLQRHNPFDAPCARKANITLAPVVPVTRVRLGNLQQWKVPEVALTAQLASSKLRRRITDAKHALRVNGQELRVEKLSVSLSQRSPRRQVQHPAQLRSQLQTRHRHQLHRRPNRQLPLASLALT